MASSDPLPASEEQKLRERIADLERELAALERELAAVRRRLHRVEALDRTYSNVALAVSHELRTPLTLISGYAQQLLLRWHKTDDARRRAMVEKINVSSRRLARLIDDMVLISDAESGDLAVQIRSVRLREVVDRALEDVRDRFPEGLPQVELTGAELQVLADGFRLEQVLICLLDNAVKHSPPQGVIAVTWEPEGADTVISVRDQGGGIAAEDLDRLFTRFGRLQQPIGQSLGGVGLGLYIARRLVEAMHGRIWVESERGVGSAFHVAVPSGH